MRQRRAPGQPRFLRAVQNANVDARLAFDPLGEQVAVGSIAHSTRCHRYDPLGADLPGERRHASDRLHRAVHGVRIERSVIASPRSEARRRLHFVDYADLPCR